MSSPWGVRPRAAFSLIELMVAVSILAFMIVGLLAMFYHVQRAFRSGVTQLDIMEGGRAVLGMMTRELQDASATRLTEGVATNFLVRRADGLVQAQGRVDPPQEMPSGKWRTNFLQDVSFLSQVNGDWTATVYCISNANTGLGTLYRRSITELYESNPLWASTNVLHLIDRAFFNETRPNRPPPAVNDPFARILDGIVHFRVTTYETNGWRDLRNETIGGTAYTNQFAPAFVDVELGVLEPKLVEKFRAMASVDVASAQNFLQRQVGRTHLFRQRVSLRPAATELYSRK